MTSTSNLQIALFCLSITLGSCKNSGELNQAPGESTYEIIKKPHSLAIDQHPLHVVGTDENGNKVHGNINIDGEIGLGTLITNDAMEIEIVVEWSGKHKLIATDLDGYEYNLKMK